MAVCSQDVFRVMSALGYDDAKVASSSEPRVLLIGDPSSLYVCSEAALASEPEPWMGTCDEGRCPIGAYIADHIVTGSSKLGASLSREARAVFYVAMEEATEDPLALDMFRAYVELAESTR